MVRVSLRKNARYGIACAKYPTTCGKCHGPVQSGETCIEFITRDDVVGYICNKCKTEAENKYR